MPTTVTLNWRRLVEEVRRGNLEPRGPDGSIGFMYCAKRNVFISDPALMAEIVRARSHRKPFMLIGAQLTGKNVFLELVASPPGAESPPDCIDENINECTDGELERLFGRGGKVDSHRRSLFHFDFMERALSWAPLIHRLAQLVLYARLERTDGSTVELREMRVVGGANCELAPLLAMEPPSLANFVYQSLSANQLVRTRSLREQPERLEQILGEILAARVLETPVLEGKAEKIERLTSEELQQLREHPWPDEFKGPWKLVDEALASGNWAEAITTTVTCKVFIIWSGRAKAQAVQLNEMLEKSGFATFFSPKSMRAGEWWPQIKMALERNDFVVFCITREVFEISREGVDLQELRESIERAQRLPRPLILPVSLDGTKPADLKSHAMEPAQYALASKLSDLQWFEMAHFELLYNELRRLCEELRRARLSSGRA